MSKNIIDLQNDLEDLKALSVMVRSYGEIASNRMKRTRDNVLTQRDFLQAIDEIFLEVRSSYAKELERLARRRGFKKGEHITFLAHNGKKVAVFLSANTGLYGDIMRRTFDLFINESKRLGAEATVIGRLGRSMMVSLGQDTPYTYFDLPDYQIESGELNEIISHLVQYEEIHVYYGKFESVTTQEPTELTISAETPIKGRRLDVRVNYIFEPSLEKVLEFFESEIFASLFDQAVRESQLAKFAARILAMDQAEGSVRKSMDKTTFALSRERHRATGRKQLNALASVSEIL